MAKGDLYQEVADEALSEYQDNSKKSSKLREDERFHVPLPPTKDHLWDHHAHVQTGCAIAALADTSGKAQTHLGNWGAGTKANRRPRAQQNLVAGVFTANVKKNNEICQLLTTSSLMS